MTSISAHIEAIRTLFTQAEALGISLWLESGWAIDARLGRITREHEDIDVAYPREREAEYLALLRSLGYDRCEQVEYGYLLWKDDMLLDTEPCDLLDSEYTFAGFPPGSCPPEKSGALQGYPVRCVSWEALYFEFLYYIDEVPGEQWREKDAVGLQIIEAHLCEESRQALRERYHANK